MGMGEGKGLKFPESVGKDKDEGRTGVRTPILQRWRGTDYETVFLWKGSSGFR